MPLGSPMPGYQATWFEVAPVEAVTQWFGPSPE